MAESHIALGEAGPVFLPNFDIASIEDPVRGLMLIKQNLAVLKLSALGTDFVDREQREHFLANIAFLKQYYERVDVLLQRGAAR